MATVAKRARAANAPYVRAPARASTTINLRAPPEKRALIDRAAQIEGKNRTDFMLEAASEKAHQVLLDRTMFALNERDFARFVELLDAPVNSNEALKRLLTKRAPWEQ